jgi:prophage regulatory protein
MSACGGRTKKRSPICSGISCQHELQLGLRLSQMVKMLAQDEVVELLGLSRQTLYLMRQAGDFPEPVKLGRRRVAWRSDVLEHWIESRETVKVRGEV